MISCEKNIGMTERIVRISVGFLVLGFGAKYLSYPVDLLAVGAGFIVAVTGATGCCMLYSMLGMDTLEKSCCGCETKAKPKRKQKK